MLFFSLVASFFVAQPIIAQEVKFNPKTPASQNFFSLNEECPGVTKPGGIVGAILEGTEAIILSDKSSFSKIECIYQSSLAMGDTPEVTRAKVYDYIVNASKSPGLSNFVQNINIALLEQRPASGIKFFEEQVYALQNIGKVSAQQEPFGYYPGRGEDLLRPIQAFWGWSVNFVFGFLIVIILFVALAIILGERLPVTKVTLTNAIPSIALALILVPLSYAITGLFIDFITIGTNVAHGFIIGRGSPGEAIYRSALEADGREACGTFNFNINGECENRGLYADDPRVNVFNIRDQIDLRPAAGVVADSIESSLDQTNPLWHLYTFIKGVIELLPFDRSISNAWLGTILNIIIGLATLWTSLKILFELLKKYLVLTILPIFSPFVFITIAFPGTGSKQIEKFLRSLASASLFFIVSYSMFLFTLLLTSASFQAQFPSASFSTYVPPLTGLETLLSSIARDAGGAGINSLIFTLLGLLVFFSIPSVLENIDKKIGGGSFTLPKFVTDAGREFRGSFGTYASLAGRTGKLTYTGAQLLKNMPSNFEKYVTNRRIRRETQVGLSPGEKGTDLYAKQQDYNKKYQNALEEYNKAKEIYLDQSRPRSERDKAMKNMGKYLADMQSITKEAQDKYGITPRGSAKDEARYKFTWRFETARLARIVKPAISSIVLSSDYFAGLNENNITPLTNEINIGSITFEYHDKNADVKIEDIKFKFGEPQNSGGEESLSRNGIVVGFHPQSNKQDFEINDNDGRILTLSIKNIEETKGDESIKQFKADVILKFHETIQNNNLFGKVTRNAAYIVVDLNSRYITNLNEPIKPPNENQRKISFCVSYAGVTEFSLKTFNLAIYFDPREFVLTDQIQP